MNALILAAIDSLNIFYLLIYSTYHLYLFSNNYYYQVCPCKNVLYTSCYHGNTQHFVNFRQFVYINDQVQITWTPRYVVKLPSHHCEYI